MYFFNHKHSPKEPVTNIPFFDIITWCNALSEMEGKTPAYYLDPAYSKILRKSPANMPLKVDAKEYIKVNKIPILQYVSPRSEWIHVRYDVDGYRLPVGFEYEYAIRGGENISYQKSKNIQDSDEYAWNALNSEGRTHKVGMKKPNPYGLYDMQGNVFEFCGSKIAGTKKRTNRPYHLDRDNPVNSIWDNWLEDGKIAQYFDSTGVVSGPSFLHGDLNLDGQHGVGVQSSPHTGLGHYYSDCGFRVVRCDEGAYPKDGLRPLSPQEFTRYIKVDKSNFGKSFK